MVGVGELILIDDILKEHKYFDILKQSLWDQLNRIIRKMSIYVLYNSGIKTI